MVVEGGGRVRVWDEAMLELGMPMGPRRLLDEVGRDGARNVSKPLAATFKDRMEVPGMLAGMVQSGLLGRKSGCGFYLYAKGKEPQPNPQVSGYQSPIANRQSPIADRQTLQERMVLLMVNEAARCLEEQIASDPADID